MIKKRILSSVVAVIVFTGVWNLCDFMYATFISRSGYRFTVPFDLIAPIAATLIFMCILLPMYTHDMEKSVDREKDFKEKRHHSAPKEDK